MLLPKKKKKMHRPMIFTVKIVLDDNFIIKLH